MEIRIKLEYRGDVYYSDSVEKKDGSKHFTEDEYKEFKSFFKKVASGESKFLSFENGINTYFFSEEILKESVITLIAN